MPQMTQNVVTYTVIVTTDNSSGKLLPYLTANVQFELDKRSVGLVGAQRGVAVDARNRNRSIRRPCVAHRPRTRRVTTEESDRPPLGPRPKRPGAAARSHGRGSTDGTITEVSGDRPEGGHAGRRRRGKRRTPYASGGRQRATRQAIRSCRSRPRAADRRRGRCEPPRPVFARLRENPKSVNSPDAPAQFLIAWRVEERRGTHPAGRTSTRPITWAKSRFRCCAASRCPSPAARWWL